jgi:hypothetical protein
MPQWSPRLKNLYWLLRMRRSWDLATRRRMYRKIKDEKKRLISLGVDQEELRLLCRCLANTRNKHAERRFVAYRAQGRLF